MLKEDKAKNLYFNAKKGKKKEKEKEKKNND